MEIQKRRYNPEETKVALIKAAETLFVKKGYSATSTQEISNLSGISKGQIRYHFGTKKELWQEVIDRCLNDFFKAIEKLFKSLTLSKNSFKQNITYFFDFLKENPQIVSIITWISIERLPADYSLRIKTRDAAFASINRAKKEGIIRKDLNHDYVVYAIIGLMFHWFEIRGNHKELLQDEVSIDKKDKFYLDTAIKIIYEGILSKSNNNSGK